MTHPNFQQVVRDTWQYPVYGNIQYNLCMKLKALKAPLKGLNKHNFSHISERVKRSQGAFEDAQAALMSDPSSHVLKSLVKECRSTTNFLLE